ncbi:MAG TPA: type II secretion system protein [Verrucomicrobiae bacterium]|nr:type II secretion system protein [Verrucomicrobiae bacterium]
MGNHRGFTLLEVMVALAITAGVILTLLTAFNHHLGIAARDREEAEALLLARGKLEEIQHEYREDMKREGSFAPERPDMTWRLEVKPAQLPGIRSLTLIVAWDGKRREISLEHYRPE